MAKSPKRLKCQTIEPNRPRPESLCQSIPKNGRMTKHRYHSFIWALNVYIGEQFLCVRFKIAYCKNSTSIKKKNYHHHWCPVSGVTFSSKVTCKSFKFKNLVSLLWRNPSNERENIIHIIGRTYIEKLSPFYIKQLSTY